MLQIIKWLKQTDTGEDQSERSEYRAAPRFPAKSQLTMRWRDPDGTQRESRGHLRNLSDFGAMVESSEPFVPGENLSFSSEDLGLEGQAQVRHCRLRAFTYRVGIKFQGPLMKTF